MQIQEALRDAPNYLRNAQEIAQRSPVNADTLYMWDNQVTAIESFLANSEDLDGQRPDLTRVRKELFALKKQIEAKVLEFELKQENQELPPEPNESELVEDMTAYGKELQELVQQVARTSVASFKDLQELEEPLQQMANFLVDTEPLKGKGAELDRFRSAVKKCREEVAARCAVALKELQSKEVDDEE